MQYFVLAPDGGEYGPADVATLKSWADDRRLMPTSRLRDASTGQVVSASSVPGIFGAGVAPPMPQTYQAPTFNYQQVDESESKKELWVTLAWSVVALGVFFGLGGWGFIIAGSTLYSAYQAKASGSKYGNLCLIIAGLTFAIVIVGWGIRLIQKP